MDDSEILVVAFQPHLNNLAIENIRCLANFKIWKIHIENYSDDLKPDGREQSSEI